MLEKSECVECRKDSTFYILISAVLWGSSFPVIKFGLDYLNPYRFAFIRFLLGTLVLSAILYLKGRKFPLHLLKDPMVFILSISNTTGILFQYAAMSLTTAIKAAFLINSSFVVVILASSFLFKERITLLMGFSLFISEVGVVLLITGGSLERIGESSFLGDVLAFLAGLSWVIYIVTNKKTVSERLRESKEAGLQVISLMTAVVFLTTLILLPWALSVGAWDDSLFRAEGLGVILYVSVGCTALPFVFYSYGLRKIKAGSSSIMLLLEVVVASLLSVLFLKESLSFYSLIGAILIILGIALVSYKNP